MNVHSTSRAPERRKNELSIIILSFAAFVIVTTEFVIIGLMPNMARDLEISIPMAGQLVTSFALIVVFAGPPLTAVVAKIERRALFTWILVAFAVSNVAVALAPGFWTVLLARVVPAALLPVFWGIGSDAAATLVSKENAGRAIAKIYFGVTGALLFGIPLGTVLGDAIGWRGAFWILAAMSALMAVLLYAAMPKLFPTEKESLRRQISSLSNRFFIANLLLSFAIFTAMFGAYTYLADMLEGYAHIEPAKVGWWLMGFGTVGLLGNYLAGRMVDSRPVMATVIFCLLMGLGAAGAIFSVAHMAIFIASLVAWGIAHTALFPLGQIRVINAAADGKALAGTLNISACNSGIAAGAILGGWAIKEGGVGAAILEAAALVAICALVSPLVARLRPAPCREEDVASSMRAANYSRRPEPIIQPELEA